jgi:hypothetical protein
MNNYAFIDGNNLYLGVRNQGWKLDYKKNKKLVGFPRDETLW